MQYKQICFMIKINKPEANTTVMDVLSYIEVHQLKRCVSKRRIQSLQMSASWKQSKKQNINKIEVNIVTKHAFVCFKC